ncbi:MAG: hypothetical protein JKY43_10670 [Phycisphaerales bacterium]|nr:hypothetical protein [Phycisphaerales bacterium]
MNRPLLCLAPALLMGCFTQSGAAQILDVQYNTPTLDRWNYPFNGSPGTRFEMTSFGALETPGFDDHDAQVLLGFETLNDITAGLGADQYRVLSVTVTMTVTNDDDFMYDPTHDTFDTYGVLGEPFDTDPGRPLNLWLTGYRGGQDQTTYFESSPFGFTADVPPAQGMRNAFAATFDTLGIPTDISNNIKEQFNAVPLAIGQSNTINPGDLVPADTTFSFTFTPCQLGDHLELGKMLDLGEIRFSISSLQPATGGPDGGGGVNYPVWYSRENPLSEILGFSPTLQIQVQIGSPGDFNGDGNRDFFDISAFLTSFTANDPSADITGDCSFDFFDISAFLTAFTTN